MRGEMGAFEEVTARFSDKTREGRSIGNGRPFLFSGRNGSNGYSNFTLRRIYLWV